MALNLKTLGVRSISALVFVIVLMGAVLYSYWSLILFFLIISVIGIHEFYNLANKLGAKPFRLPGYLLGVSVFLAFVDFTTIFNYYFKQNVFAYLSILTMLFLLTTCVLKLRQQPILDLCYTVFGVTYVSIPFALVGYLAGTWSSLNQTGESSAWTILSVIFLIWSNDTFAYLGGSLFGKHKLLERVSPGKTWEGTVFGVLVTIVVSFLLQTYLLHSENMLLWITLGILVPITATIGDLFESLLKRKAGVKDSGSLMPGHGGVLDRFDSLLFVVPVTLVVVKFLS
ncbi:MAG: phosphatidate cytidylyltransferase [Bacteroidota bacterium]|jgi:phosphatidate cytidylyltransferase